MRTALAALSLALAVGGPPPARAGTAFAVDPDAGNNTFTAVFDAAVGERITAVSSAVACTLAVDEAKLEGKAVCSVPLNSIRVDNDDVKSEHFRQWATNKTVDPKKCVFALEVPAVKLAGPVEPMKPVEFETEGRFTICGRQRDRARIEGFDRERYQVGARWTAGWLARVQQLAPVVATEGTIDVNLFAMEPQAP